MTKKAAAERQEVIEQLREIIKPGQTVYTILDHVSSSGMSRAIRVLIPAITGNQVESVAPNGKVTDYIQRAGLAVDFLHPNWAVGKALGLRHWKRNGREQDALVVGGCGMDMGSHLVYELSATLYGQGYACLGKGKCPSNYHVNHRDEVRCSGTGGHFCYVPREDDDAPRGPAIDIGDGQTIPGPHLAVLATDHPPYIVCPTCNGAGYFPNPDGPERFDLTHTDGYALRHKWL